MGKIHVDHRVVVRNADDQIVRETAHGSFVAAKPVFDEQKTRLEDGEVLTLQHGIRVIFCASAGD